MVCACVWFLWSISFGLRFKYVCVCLLYYATWNRFWITSVLWDRTLATNTMVLSCPLTRSHLRVDYGFRVERPFVWIYHRLYMIKAIISALGLSPNENGLSRHKVLNHQISGLFIKFRIFEIDLCVKWSSEIAIWIVICQVVYLVFYTLERMIRLI